MARPLRVEVEGGWYHVISRGIERRSIFQDDADRRDFLERLFALMASHGVAVHAYCLMENHFHLQLQTPRANLKEAMQRLLSGYVVRFNLRHHRVGPLFQGRYRAILAGEGEWISEVNRYIHLNPVRLESLGLGKERQAQERRGVADAVGEAVVRERLNVLREYAWSSYRAYAGYCRGPGELQQTGVLGCFEGNTDEERRSALRDHTERAIREGVEGDTLLDRVRYGVLLGSEEWMGKMRGLLSGDAREQTAIRRARKEAAGFEEVSAAIARTYGQAWEMISVRRGHPARGLAIVLCRRHTALTLNEIGERLGGMDYAAVSQACHRMEQKMIKKLDLAATAELIAARLDMSYVET
jgi:REP element-mobilizing transposase RayT